MDNRFFWTRAFFALALAACGGNTSTAGGPGGAGGPSVAQSAVVRVPATSVSQASIAAAVRANNEFALDLYAHVRESAPTGNLLTSPISASLALTMTYAGAKGATSTQMASALHFGTDASAILEGQNALSQVLAQDASDALKADTQSASAGGSPAPSPGDYAVQVVNSVWGQTSYPWAPSFLDVLAKNYGAGIYQEDFASQPDPARLAINAWVSNRTADKINDLLPVGSINANTRMVLVNAIHLKLPWVTAFSKTNTMPSTFVTASGGTVNDSAMNQSVETGYADDGQAQIVSLPLAGNELRVVIALPHGDLATYEKGLSVSSTAFQPLGSAQVVLSLPRFAFTSPTFSLAAALQAMGMTDAFEPGTADFTGMCTQPLDGKLYVADVLQKAMLAAQETGIEAAAATAVILARHGLVSMPVAMVVNRPFLVAIVDESGAILFLGHIDDPTAMGGP
jgi:serpin B